MEQRINAFEKAPGALKALYGIGGYLAKSPVEGQLLDLIYFRVSQINGCAFCLDMHSKDLRAHGETEQRLYMVAANVPPLPGPKPLLSLTIMMYPMMFMNRPANSLPKQNWWTLL